MDKGLVIKMSVEAEQKTINVAPINLAPHEESVIKDALESINSTSQNCYPYVLLENNAAKDAEILIANLSTSDFSHTNQLLQRVYGVKSTVFIVQDSRLIGQSEYKYIIKRNELDNNLANLLNTVSRDELKLKNATNPSNKSENSNRSITTSYQQKKPFSTIGRVLIVDDSPSVRTQMNLYLNKRGFDCYLAESSEEAIRAVKLKQFDLIFLDIVMPGADGYQACKAIKSFESTKNVPVILLTSKNSPIDKIHGIMSGCDKYLTKPVSSSELNELLQSYFPVLKQA